MDEKSVLGQRLLLQARDGCTLKLDDPLAAQANHVVVMALPVRLLVTHAAVAEIALHRQRGGAQQGQCAIDRRQPHLVPLRGEPLIQFIGGDVLALIKKRLHDVHALLGELLPVALKMGLQNLQWLGHGVVQRV